MSDARRLVKLLHAPLAEIADGVGVSYDTVKAWSHGRSQPTPANRMALACFGGRHAAELLTIAERLKEGESQPAEQQHQRPANQIPHGDREAADTP